MEHTVGEYDLFRKDNFGIKLITHRFIQDLTFYYYRLVNYYGDREGGSTPINPHEIAFKFSEIGLTQDEMKEIMQKTREHLPFSGWHCLKEFSVEKLNEMITGR